MTQPSLVDPVQQDINSTSNQAQAPADDHQSLLFHDERYKNYVSYDELGYGGMHGVEEVALKCKHFYHSLVIIVDFAF